MAGPSSVPVIRYDLASYGVVTQVVSAIIFRVAGLAGQGDGAFEGYGVYLLKKADGTTTPPHGDLSLCTNYQSATGSFTHGGFSALAAVGDAVLLLHPSLAAPLLAVYSIDSWSEPQEEVAVAQAPGTLALPAVAVADIPVDATVVRAMALVKFRVVENTNAAVNALDGATVAATSQVIQVQHPVTGAWHDAINFVDDMFSLAATTRESGDVLIGSIDLAAVGAVNRNGIYNMRWLLAQADEDNLNLNDVACGIRVWFAA